MTIFVGKNPGKLIQNIIENDFDLMIDKIKNELGYTVRQTVLTQLEDFKKFKGVLDTFIKYCKVLNYTVSFKVIKGNQKIENDNLEEILEKIRKNYKMTKEKFSNKILNLSDYNYTYRTFERKSCQFKKIRDIFEKKLDYEFYYILKERSDN
jgi:hypothetical protein